MKGRLLDWEYIGISNGIKGFSVGTLVGMLEEK